MLKAIPKMIIRSFPVSENPNQSRKNGTAAAGGIARIERTEGNSNRRRVRCHENTIPIAIPIAPTYSQRNVANPAQNRYSPNRHRSSKEKETYGKPDHWSRFRYRRTSGETRSHWNQQQHGVGCDWRGAHGLGPGTLDHLEAGQIVLPPVQKIRPPSNRLDTARVAVLNSRHT